MASLSCRAAFITGAGRLGCAIARAFVREGARVAIADLDAERAEALAEKVGGIGIQGDLTTGAEVERTVAAAEEGIGPLDILVNAHGIFPNTPLLDMSEEEWDRVFAVNVRSVMLTSRALARLLIERGTPGAIVNLSSFASRSARAGSAHYAASKAAVNMLTQVLAIELGPHNIRVNAVLPGLVVGDPVTTAAPDLRPYDRAMIEATPLARTGSPEEIAQAVLFLASDASSWTTGALLDITGGAHCGRAHMPASLVQR